MRGDRSVGERDEQAEPPPLAEKRPRREVDPRDPFAVLEDERFAAHERRARSGREPGGVDRLRAVTPDFDVLLERWVLSGPSLAIQVTRAIKLLDLYGNETFATAVAELVARGLRDIGALAMACERLRKERGRPVPVDIVMPAHVDDRDVVPHDLGSYDDN